MRELFWLSDGRQQSEWNQLASAMVNVRAAFGDGKISVESLIPERFRPKPPPQPKLSEEVQQVHTNAAFEVLGRFLMGGS